MDYTFRMDAEDADEARELAAERMFAQTGRMPGQVKCRNNGDGCFDIEVAGLDIDRDSMRPHSSEDFEFKGRGRGDNTFRYRVPNDDPRSGRAGW